MTVECRGLGGGSFRGGLVLQCGAISAGLEVMAARPVPSGVALGAGQVGKRLHRGFGGGEGVPWRSSCSAAVRAVFRSRAVR